MNEKYTFKTKIVISFFLVRSLAMHAECRHFLSSDASPTDIPSPTSVYFNSSTAWFLEDKQSLSLSLLCRSLLQALVTCTRYVTIPFCLPSDMCFSDMQSRSFYLNYVKLLSFIPSRDTSCMLRHCLSQKFSRINVDGFVPPRVRLRKMVSQEKKAADLVRNEIREWKVYYQGFS